MDTPEQCRNWVRREWRQHTARIWREFQDEYGVRIPRPDRDEVENDYSDELEALTFVADPTVRRDKLEHILAQFRELAEEALRRVLRAVRENLAASKEPAATPRRNTPSQERPANAFRLRHRLAVLRFVADREVSLLAQAEGHLKPPGRVAWPPVAADWNRSHPRDPLKRETLARYFRRARGDRRVVEIYVAERRSFWQRHKDVLDALGPPGRLRVAESPDGGRYRITARLPEKEGSAQEAAAKQRCALTATIFAWPRQTRFCRKNCARCRLPAQFLEAGLLVGDRRVLRSRRELDLLRVDSLAAFGAQWKLEMQRGEPAAVKPEILVSREEALANAERALAAFRRARRAQERPSQ